MQSKLSANINLAQGLNFESKTTKMTNFSN